MPNPWLNVHKSTAAMNYFLILNTISELLCDIRYSFVEIELRLWVSNTVNQNIVNNKQSKDNIQKEIYSNSDFSEQCEIFNKSSKILTISQKKFII